MRSLFSAVAAVLLSFSVTQFAVAADDFETPIIGVHVVDLADAKKPIRDVLKLELPTNAGVVVLKVQPYGPADKAGIRPLDIITSIDGKQIKANSDFQTIAKTFKAGEKCKISGYTQPARNAASRRWRRGTVEIRPAKRKDVILAAMKKEVDEIKERSFFEHRDTPSTGTQSDVKVYFSVKDGKAEGLRMVIRYVGEDWLFINQFAFKANGKTFTIAPPLLDGVERDHAAGRIWEWYDFPVEAKERAMLDSILADNEPLLRCEGKQYKKDRTLEVDERERLSLVLLAFKVMGGE